LSAVDGPDVADAAKPGDAIAWGKPVDGLKAGIGFRRGEDHVARIGGSVTLVVYLRNENPASITVTHTENLFEEFVPHVRDASSRAMRIQPGPFHTGDVPQVTRTLEPGETIRLDHAWFLVRPADWNGQVESPTLRTRPGVYTVACENIPLRLKGRDRDDMKWSTGWVELRVEGPPAANEAAIVEAEAQVARSEVGCEYRRAELARMRKLYEAKAIEKRLVDEAEDRLKSAEAERNVARARLKEVQAPPSKPGEEPQANLDAAEAELKIAEAKLNRWQAEVDRLRKLLVQGAIDPRVLVEATSQLKAAQAARDAARARVQATPEAKATATRELEIEVAKATVALAEAEYVRRQHEVERNREMAKKLAIGKGELQESEDQLRIAAASLELAKAKLKAVQSNLPPARQ
jgi:multidrug resistance efflux pump